MKSYLWKDGDNEKFSSSLSADDFPKRKFVGQFCKSILEIGMDCRSIYELSYFFSFNSLMTQTGFPTCP
jgi:hypothetical protein